MAKLTSKLTHIMGIGGVTIRPGSNDVSDAELKKVVAHDDGAFFVENAKFIIPKSTSSKSKSN